MFPFKLVLKLRKLTKTFLPIQSIFMILILEVNIYLVQQHNEFGSSARKQKEIELRLFLSILFYSNQTDIITTIYNLLIKQSFSHCKNQEILNFISTTTFLHTHLQFKIPPNTRASCFYKHDTTYTYTIMKQNKVTYSTSKN